jgi:putative MFS transporter
LTARAKITFAICFGAYALSQAELALLSYALPPLRQSMGFSLLAVTLAISAAYVLGGLLQVWFGHLTDRFGRRNMLQVSLAGASLFVAAHAGISSLWQIVVLRAGSIFTGGALYPATGAMVTEVAPARYRGLMAGLLQAAYPLGWFLAAAIAAPLLVRWGWRSLFLVPLLALPYLWVIRRFLVETERFDSVRAANAQRPLRESVAGLFAPSMRRRTLTLLLAQFLFVIAYGSSALLFPTYFNESRQLNVGSSTWLVGFGNLIGVLGYVLAALVGEFWLTRRTTVVVWTLLGAMALLFLVWGTGGYYDTLAAFGVMSMFFYGTAAVKFAFVAELFPTHLRATGLAVCTSLPVNFGIALGPPLMAYAKDRIGWNLTFSFLIALPLVCAGLLYLLLKPLPSGLELEDIQGRLGRDDPAA